MSKMNLEHIARQGEIERALEDNKEKWVRKERSLKKKEIKFYQHDMFKRYTLAAMLGITIAVFCSYIGYKIVNQGSAIIERHIDEMSIFYLDE